MSRQIELRLKGTVKFNRQFIHLDGNKTQRGTRNKKEEGKEIGKNTTFLRGGKD